MVRTLLIAPTLAWLATLVAGLVLAGLGGGFFDGS